MKTKKMKIGDLDRAIREELFNLHACFINPDATERDFYSRLVPIKTIDLRAIPKEALYSLDAHQVERYSPTLTNPSTKFPAIAGESLIDGLHRISTAIAKGQTKMEVVDLGKLINTDESDFQIKVKVIPEKQITLSM